MSKHKRISKFPLANKYSKKAVEKLIEAAGFIPDDMDDDGWVIPNGVGSTYYDQVFQVGTKYMIVATGYEIETDYKGKSYISFAAGESSKITYKQLPEDMLKDLINRAWKMYKDALIDLNEVNASKDFQ
jgi:hypothetical protein